MSEKKTNIELNTDISTINKISLGYYALSIVLLLLPFYSAYGLISFSGFQIIFMGWSILWIYLIVAIVGLGTLFVKNIDEYKKNIQKYAPIALGLITLWVLLEGMQVAGIGLWLMLILHVAMIVYSFLPEIKKVLNK